jgi:hypothetical protein
MPHSVHNSTSTQTKMSRPSSTSTYSGNVVEAFPKQAGAQLLSPEVATGPLSPSPTQFSFASSPHSVQESEQLANDGPRRPTTRGTTGDALGELRPPTSRSRAQYYEDSFAYKEGHGQSARDRVTKDAPIVAELRTNVIVRLIISVLHLLPVLTQRRSRTSIPWLRTYHTTFRRDTSGPRLPS